MSSGYSVFSEYIVHHLAHFNSSGKPQLSLVDFSVLNLDTVFYSIFTAFVVGIFLRYAAFRATIRAPNRFVGSVEYLVEMVERQSRLIVKGDIRYIAPLALCSLIWVVAMNALDMLPVDLLPSLGHFFGIKYMRVVPTADLNGTLSLAIVVLLASIYYGIQQKKLSGFFCELFSAPFGSRWFLAPFNIAMQLIEYVAKTVSMGMRLFGNMFAGELVFMLIAMLGGSAVWWAMGLHFLSGLLWSIFHILIISLQGFIFMMLTLVYIGQARDSH